MESKIVMRNGMNGESMHWTMMRFGRSVQNGLSWLVTCFLSFQNTRRFIIHFSWKKLVAFSNSTDDLNFERSIHDFDKHDWPAIRLVPILCQRKLLLSTAHALWHRLQPLIVVTHAFTSRTSRALQNGGIRNSLLRVYQRDPEHRSILHSHR